MAESLFVPIPRESVMHLRANMIVDKGVITGRG
jgi:hypothetical protein